MTTTEIDPKKVIEYLEDLLTKLKSPEVEGHFMSKSTDVREKYIDLRFEIKLLIEKLTLQRLRRIQGEMNKRASELTRISEELKGEIESLESTRKVFDRIEKIVALASRFALRIL